MKPYYDDGAVTIYHADCREVLPTFAENSFDLLLTDPPYGIRRDGQYQRNTKLVKHRRRKYEAMGWDRATPEQGVFDQMFRVTKEQVIWGGNYFAPYLPPRMGWLVWDKGQRLTMSDGEIAFTSRQAALRILTLNRASLVTDGIEDHPTQKPMALIRWCLSFFPESFTVIDPFAGSGTTGRVAKDLGRKAVLIEIEERYCEIAANRLAQSVLPLEVS